MDRCVCIFPAARSISLPPAPLRERTTLDETSHTSADESPCLGPQELPKTRPPCQEPGVGALLRSREKRGPSHEQRGRWVCTTERPQRGRATTARPSTAMDAPPAVPRGEEKVERKPRRRRRRQRGSCSGDGSYQFTPPSKADQQHRLNGRAQPGGLEAALDGGPGCGRSLRGRLSPTAFTLDPAAETLLPAMETERRPLSLFYCLLRCNTCLRWRERCATREAEVPGLPGSVLSPKTRPATPRAACTPSQLQNVTVLST
eukprot:XP_028345304.1 uncharacterized protein LOC114486256 isoform X1 [Physeter catodon]